MADEPTPEEQAAAAAAAAAASAATAEQLTAANAQITALTDDLRGALKIANPDLPETSFAGETADAVKTSVAAARAVADHIKASAPPATTPATVTPPAIAAMRTDLTTPPDGIKGVDRIRFALNQRS
jgi:hypothetical protein